MGESRVAPYFYSKIGVGRSSCVSQGWTDSKVVLGYINNETRGFHVFVADRVQQIRDYNTTPSQWLYIESKLNPADEASRDLKTNEIINNSRWIYGLDFLYEQREDWGELDQPSDMIQLQPDVPKWRELPYLQVQRTLTQVYWKGWNIFQAGTVPKELSLFASVMSNFFLARWERKHWVMCNQSNLVEITIPLWWTKWKSQSSSLSN